MKRALLATILTFMLVVGIAIQPVDAKKFDKYPVMTSVSDSTIILVYQSDSVKVYYYIDLRTDILSVSETVADTFIVTNPSNNFKAYIIQTGDSTLTISDSSGTYTLVELATDTDTRQAIAQEILGSPQWSTNADSVTFKSTAGDVTISITPAGAAEGDYVVDFSLTETYATQSALADTASDLRVAISAAGDNLGDHTATENINIGVNYISGDGADFGITTNTTGIGFGNVPTPGALVDAYNAAGDSYMRFSAPSGSSTGLQLFEGYASNSGGGFYYDGGANRFYLGTYSTTFYRMMTIERGKYFMGIGGDITPDATLEVVQSINDHDPFMVGTAAGDGDWFIIKDVGTTANVGVGNNDPKHKLQVSGGSYADSVGINNTWTAVAKDTTELKTLNLRVGSRAYLCGLGDSTDVGGGWFTAQIASYPTGGVAFAHPSGLGTVQWVRDAFLVANHYNVRWYGAKGDSTTDDITAFARTVNSINKANQWGAVVYIPAGRYRLSTTWTIPNEVRKIYGESAGIVTGYDNVHNYVDSPSYATDDLFTSLIMFSGAANDTAIVIGNSLNSNAAKNAGMTFKDFAICDLNHTAFAGVFNNQQGYLWFDNVHVSAFHKGTAFYLWGGWLNKLTDCSAVNSKFWIKQDSTDAANNSGLEVSGQRGYWYNAYNSSVFTDTLGSVGFTLYGNVCLFDGIYTGSSETIFDIHSSHNIIQNCYFEQNYKVDTLAYIHSGSRNKFYRNLMQTASTYIYEENGGVGHSFVDNGIVNGTGAAGIEFNQPDSCYIFNMHDRITPTSATGHIDLGNYGYTGGPIDTGAPDTYWYLHNKRLRTDWLQLPDEPTTTDWSNQISNIWHVVGADDEADTIKIVSSTGHNVKAFLSDPMISGIATMSNGADSVKVAFPNGKDLTKLSFNVTFEEEPDGLFYINKIDGGASDDTLEIRYVSGTTASQDRTISYYAFWSGGVIQAGY